MAHYSLRLGVPVKVRGARPLVMILALAIGFVRVGGQGEDNRADVANILKKAEAYCQRLENAALDFICFEEVTELYSHYTPAVDVYVFDYQYVRKDKETREKRKLLSKNGEKPRNDAAGLKTVMFSYENVLFGPVGLLSKYWQAYHNYTLVSRETYEKKRVIILEAKPKPDNPLPHPYGRIWVKEDDGAVMRIVWDQESLGNFEGVEEWVRAHDAEPAITAITDYNIEKNGLQFPSGSFSEQACYLANKKKMILAQLVVVYKKYKFFTVETEVSLKPPEGSAP